LSSSWPSRRISPSRGPKALAAGDRIEIRGLGSFVIKEYDSYTGRNPKTGQPITVKPKKLPFFKVGKELKERVLG
jgi:integration host factor subunit beta